MERTNKTKKAPVRKPVINPTVKSTLPKEEKEEVMGAMEIKEDIVHSINPIITPSSQEAVIQPVNRLKLRYKLLTGTLRILGKTVKKNEVFEAYPEQIPTVFKRSIVCVSDPDTQAMVLADQEKLIPKKEISYEVRPATAKGWYNVVNKITGKPINEKSLRLEDANSLMEALNN